MYLLLPLSNLSYYVKKGKAKKGRNPVDNYKQHKSPCLATIMRVFALLFNVLLCIANDVNVRGHGPASPPAGEIMHGNEADVIKSQIQS